MSSKTVMRVVVAVVAVGLVAVELRRDPDAAAVTTCLTVGPVASVLGDHASADTQHRLFVTPLEVAEAQVTTYEMQGADADHVHAVTLRAEHFERLGSDDDVTVVSTAAGSAPGHAHPVVIACP